MHFLGAPIFHVHRCGAISRFPAWRVVCIVIDSKHGSRKETSMQQGKLFEELSAKINALLAQSPAKDLEKNLRALMTSFFGRLDLVTREEFDVQARLLARTREQLSALESRVAELEARTAKANT
jgi:BMFP domain-containing protein YqiC